LLKETTEAFDGTGGVPTLPRRSTQQILRFRKVSLHTNN